LSKVTGGWGRWRTEEGVIEGRSVEDSRGLGAQPGMAVPRGPLGKIFLGRLAAGATDRVCL